MGRTRDLIGVKFNSLTFISFHSRDKNRRLYYLCKCDCGNETIVAGVFVTNGHTKSCGCLSRKKASERLLKHGASIRRNGGQDIEYTSWVSMKSRCLNPNNPNYNNYGGRGISIDPRWIDSFESFISDMGARPSIRHSLDRFPNVNGNYEPGNCRWGTDDEQARGKRNNVWVEYEGVRMIVADFKRKIGITTGNQYVFKLLERMTPTEVAEWYKNKKNE